MNLLSRLSILLCVALAPVFLNSAAGTSKATEMFSRILESWEHETFWHMRPSVPAGYAEGKRVSFLMFGSKHLAGYCSCDLQECREFSVYDRIKFGETDQTTLEQPCDVYSASAWYLLERTRSGNRVFAVEIYRYPATSPPVMMRSPPVSGPGADEVARLGLSLARALVLGQRNLGNILTAACAELGNGTAPGVVCPQAAELDRNLEGEIFVTQLPKLKVPRAVRERVVPKAAETLISLVKERTRPQSGGPCGLPELVLPFFEDSDRNVVALYRSANCTETILSFGRSEEGEWVGERAVESPPLQEFYKKKIENHVMSRVRIGDRTKD